MFSCHNAKRIGVVLLDNKIQITYNHHTIEYPFTGKIFWYRVVANFYGCEIFVKQIFKELFSSSFRLFGNIEVYVTSSPLSGELEMRALNEIFKANRCVKKVYPIDFPIAASIRLRLNSKAESILIDIDEEILYVSVLRNEKVIQYKDFEVLNRDINKTICCLVKWLTDNTYQNMDIWVIGGNKKIRLIHKSLQKIMKKEVHLYESNTVILEGVDMIIHQHGI